MRPFADFSAADAPTVIIEPTFLPENYRPERRATVRLLDRGEAEKAKQYVLQDDASGRHLAISAEDMRLWDMFDGQRTVQDVLRDYVRDFRTLPLNRIVRLVGELWEQGFLLTDPGLTPTARRQAARPCPFRYKRIALPLIAGIPRLLARIGATRLVQIPVVSVTSILGVGGLLLSYPYARHLLARPALFRPVESWLFFAVSMLLLNALLSLLRELVKGVVAAKHGQETSSGGLLLRWCIPLFYAEQADLAGCPRRIRFRVLFAGIWFDAF